ncbi:MAG: MerR family transcriptional regulator [Pseudomonadales bacterium]|nr:MerR family transcriptional regulator [Pseudomonadales bacterium]
MKISDSTFLEQFENQTLAPEHFNHYGHLRLAWLYLNSNPLEEAIQKVTNGFSSYANSLGVTDKFHHTLTEAIVRIMASRLPHGKEENLDVYLENNRDLVDDIRAAVNVHYSDKLGLLKPSSRSDANYRQYTKQDYQRLSKIMAYREAGVPLATIIELLEDNQQVNRAQILEEQIEQLNAEILKIRKQQQATIELLKSGGLNLPTRSMNKNQWVELLESVGMSETDMWTWHAEFEKRMPQAHQDFLESLNISEEEIQQIRKKSK